MAQLEEIAKGHTPSAASENQHEAKALPPAVPSAAPAGSPPRSTAAKKPPSAVSHVSPEPRTAGRATYTTEDDETLLEAIRENHRLTGAEPLRSWFKTFAEQVGWNATHFVIMSLTSIY